MSDVTKNDDAVGLILDDTDRLEPSLNILAWRVLVKARERQSSGLGIETLQSARVMLEAGRVFD